MLGGIGRVFRSFSNVQTQNKQMKTLNNHDNQLLPNQISASILDLEMECERETISKPIIFQLLAEYTKAVEFYQEQGNDKHKLYSKRMHNFLTQPKIEQILKGKSGQMAIKKQKKQETIKKASMKAQQEVKQMLKIQEVKEKKFSQNIADQLNKQDLLLEERIRKKRILSTRSSKSKQDLNNQQSGEKKLEKMDMKMFLQAIVERKTLRNVFQ